MYILYVWKTLIRYKRGSRCTAIMKGVQSTLHNLWIHAKGMFCIFLKKDNVTKIEKENMKKCRTRSVGFPTGLSRSTDNAASLTHTFNITWVNSYIKIWKIITYENWMIQIKKIHTSSAFLFLGRFFNGFSVKSSSFSKPTPRLFFSTRSPAGESEDAWWCDDEACLAERRTWLLDPFLLDDEPLLLWRSLEFLPFKNELPGRIGPSAYGKENFEFSVSCFC